MSATSLLTTEREVTAPADASPANYESPASLLLVALWRHLEFFRRAEHVRFRGHLGSLTGEQQEALEAATAAIVAEICQRVRAALAACRDGAEREVVAAQLEQLFELRRQTRPADFPR